MFAYCQNNPVMYVDTSGNRHMMVDLGIVIIESEPELKTAGLSANNASNSSKLVDDIENFDLFNTDENKVMDANYFSAYKGKLVVWQDNFSRSGYYGIIFMSEKNRGYNIYTRDIVRHEYGHTIQLKELGVMKYTFCIFIPSANEWGSELYYYKPWELSASIYGGAHSLYKKSKYNQMVKAHQYIDESRKFGIYSWRLIE